MEDAFGNMLAEAKRCRDEAIELARQVTEGSARLEEMSAARVLEVLNGCISDYNTILKRLAGRNRG